MGFIIATIVLEAAAPICVSNGEAGPNSDNGLVRDAHGMPTITGPSLAGAMRALLSGEAGINALFGQGGTKDNLETRDQSRLYVGFASVHGGDDRPMDGPVGSVEPSPKDDVAQLLLTSSPVRRDHVALDEFGVADDRAKFDVSAVPIGTRFTLRLKLDLCDPHDEAQRLFSVLCSHIRAGRLRVGGHTRRGYGRMKCLRMAMDEIDLSTRDATALDRLRLANEPLRAFVWANERVEVTFAEPTTVRGSETVRLTPVDYWHIGGAMRNGNEKQLYCEPVIRWDGSKGRVNRMTLIPGSSFKGALRHRTLFHLGCAMDGDKGGKLEQAMESLFGSIRDGVGEEGSGKAGCLYIDDVLFRPSAQNSPLPVADRKMITHNSIDRFTGGTRDGALVAFDVAHSETFDLRYRIDHEVLKKRDGHETVLSAFQTALTDLCEERLAIGGLAAKGHGYFTTAVGEHD